MKKYQLIENKIILENIQITTYGIKCKSQSVKDISTNKAYVKKIIEDLNRHKVSEIHLRDIVDDFLATDKEKIASSK